MRKIYLELLLTAWQGLVRPLWVLPGLIGVVNQTSFAQSMKPPGWQAQLETGGWAATGQVQPFWLRANQWGCVPLTAPSGSLGASLWKPYRQDTTAKGGRRTIDWSVGTQIIGNAATGIAIV